MFRAKVVFFTVVLMLLIYGAATSTADEVADWRVEGEQIGADFAHSIAMVGDVNGDGYGDVLAGSPRHDSGVYREGTVFAYYGSPAGLRLLSDWRVGGGQTGARFGSAVGDAGDVNGDGYDDVIVGAPEYNGANGTKSGAAFLFYGGADGLSQTPNWSLEGPHGNAMFGSAVAGAGDVNGDGYDDVIVGARWYGNGEEREGAVFVFCSSPDGPGDTPCWQVESNEGNAMLGSAVAGVGDVDGDGYADVAMGAPNGQHNGVVTGYAAVYYGSESGVSASPQWMTFGTAPEAGFGVAVAGAGDVDGNGYPDLLVGAPGHSEGFESEGAAFLFRADKDGLRRTATWQFTGGQPWAFLGSAVSGAGDLNGDGYDDVIVGAPYYSDDQPAEGAALLFFGWAGGLENVVGWQTFGDKAEAHFGYSVSGGADVARDGHIDIVVGAPDYRRSENIVGCAFGFYGAFSHTTNEAYVYLPFLARR